MWGNLRKVRLSLQHSGLARTAQRALQRLLPPWLFDANSLIAHEVKFSECRLPPANEEWLHRWANKDDLELLTQSGLSAKEVHALLDQGGYAAMCAKDGKLVASTWYLPNPYVTYNWVRVVPDQALYVAAAYVAPEFRGRRLHLETRKFAYAALADLGYNGIISFVEHLNKSSLRTGGVTPRRYLGRLSYLRLLGTVVYRFDGKWGVGFWNRSQPLNVRFQDLDWNNFQIKHKDAISGLDNQ